MMLVIALLKFLMKVKLLSLKPFLYQLITTIWLSLIILGSIHIHPNMGAFMSSVDLHTALQYQKDIPEAVACVCSTRDGTNPFFFFRITHEGMKILQKCQHLGANSFERSNFYNISEQFRVGVVQKEDRKRYVEGLPHLNLQNQAEVILWKINLKKVPSPANVREMMWMTLKTLLQRRGGRPKGSRNKSKADNTNNEEMQQSHEEKTAEICNSCESELDGTEPERPCPKFTENVNLRGNGCRTCE
jgi:hypothetical protein